MGLKNIFQNTIARASIILAVFTLVAKLTGLMRDRVLATQFGASSSLDIYYSAFKIPDLIFNLLILGAVSAAFIPIFVERHRTDARKAFDLAQNFLNVSFMGVLVLCALAFIFAEPLAYLVAPGFSASDNQTLAWLLRIMLLSPVIFAASNVFGAILQSLERFTAYAIAPIFYNAGIIFGAWYIVPVVRNAGFHEVYGLGLGVIVGAFWHLLIQMPFVLNAGFRFGAAFRVRDEDIRRIVRLTIPRTLALGSYQIGLVATNIIASLIGTGSITVLNLATNLQFLPISIVGISVATAIFPKFSFYAASDEKKHMFSELQHVLKWVGLLSGTIALLLFIFRNFVVKLIFMTGAFSHADANVTATVFGILLFAVPAQSLVHIIMRTFYALKDTKTPLYSGLLALLITIGGSVLLAIEGSWGIRGIAFATMLGANANFLFLYIKIKTRI